jgi:alkyl hydroperoxide reductase subunit AhpF
MSLLSPQDQQAVRDRLAPLAHDVSLVFFTQTVGAPETALVTRQILDEVASLHPRVGVEEVNFLLDRDRVAAFGVEDLPAVALTRDGADTRMRFLGAPLGYEFMSLIDAVVLAGTGDSGLSDESRTLVAAHVTSPRDIKVFATPT